MPACLPACLPAALLFVCCLSVAALRVSSSARLVAAAMFLRAQVCGFGW